MTTNLRDRMAVELDQVEPIENLTFEAVRQGRSVVRRRRAGLGVLVAAGAFAGVAWVGVAVSGEDPLVIADRSPGAEVAGSPREEWAQRLGRVFAENLPDGFAGPVVQVVESDSEALRIYASGPRGQVELNATVYLAPLPVPACTSPEGVRCDVYDTPAGSATVLRDAYGRDDPTRASQIWIQQAGTDTIVNVVERTPGESQFTQRDLVALATDRGLADLITYAIANADDLRDYAVS